MCRTLSAGVAPILHRYQGLKATSVWSVRRNCERPGCAEPASVAFGMVPEDLMVWLEACDPATLGERRPGLLCRRHADAMVVPVGWTLDDHREAIPRLFKVAAPRPAEPARPSDNTGRMRRPRLRQESLLDLMAQEMLDSVQGDEDVDVDRREAEPSVADLGGGSVDTADEAGAGPADESVAAAHPTPAWTPRFDRSDDLDGLLSARSPLLRRAFGTDGQ